jgi:hypothetical protein
MGLDRLAASRLLVVDADGGARLGGRACQCNNKKQQDVILWVTTNTVICGIGGRFFTSE